MKMLLRYVSVMGLLLAAVPVMAAPFHQKMSFVQPDGTEIELAGRGDEFHAVFETLNGYTVVFDPSLHAYRYVRVSADGSALEPVGPPVGKADPLKLGLATHQRISRAARQALVKERFKRWDAGVKLSPRWAARKQAVRLAAGAGQAAMSPKTGALPSPPSFSTTGTKVGLTLLIDFDNDPATIPRASIVDFCNGASYAGYGNNGSVMKYFLDNSNGLLQYTNVVTVYIRIPNSLHPKSWYNDTSRDCGDQANLLIRDALAIMKAMPNYASDILPQFGDLTVDGYGDAVAFNVFYAGGNGGVWSYGLWPHSWALYNVGAQSLGNGKNVYNYQITNIGTSLELATFCHENGHSLCGYPDLYDYDDDSVGGAGDFCLMGWGGDYALNPTQICGYLKRASGWATTIDLDSNSMVTASVSSSGAGFNTFYRYLKPGTDTEYYLVENRQKSGRDANLPGSGIAIWHIDELGDGNNQSTAYNSSHLNYEASLVQADNQLHFQKYTNYGDAKDLYYQGNGAAGYANTFSDITAPCARWWDGTASGIKFRGFSASGGIMTFLAGREDVVLVLESAGLTAESGSVTNGLPDPGEMVSVDFTFRNISLTPATDVVATLLATGGVVNPCAPRDYGTINSGGATATRSFPFTATGVPGGSLTTVLKLQSGTLDLGAFTNVFTLGHVVIDSVANLGLSLTDSPDPVVATSNLTYMLVITNLGPATATNVVVTDVLPPGVVLASAIASQGLTDTNTNGRVIINLGDLTARSGATISLTVVPLDGGTVTNLATLTSDVIDPNHANNTAMTATSVLSLPRLVVSPAGHDFGVVTAGQVVRAAFSLSNPGSITLTGTASVEAPFVLDGGSYFTVPGGGTRTMEVSFSSDSVGTFADTLAFASTGGATNCPVSGTVTRVPTASFAALPLVGVAPLEVTFFDSSSGVLTNRNWDFGDGCTTNTGATTLGHRYDNAGTNTVTLTVSGPDGSGTQMRTTYIIVLPPTPPAKTLGLTAGTLPILTTRSGFVFSGNQALAGALTASVGTLEYLVVGGGGAGQKVPASWSNPNGGGGGGGGGVAAGFLNAEMTSYNVTVGAGGAANAGNGAGSSLVGVVSVGGGYGGGQKTGGTSGSGFAGGGGISPGGGGGGGGAAWVGNTASDQFGGNGGAGVLSSITGVASYYGGGGGGAAGLYTTGNGGAGGAGGGGTGGEDAKVQANGWGGGSGSANTGGGGGGGPRGYNGGAGGSGVVIVHHYGDSAAASGGNLVAISDGDGNYYRTFTASGTFGGMTPAGDQWALFSGNLSGPGGLTKDAAGTLVLAGDNSYQGATLINSGTLCVNGTLGTGAVTVAVDGILSGCGTINGPVTVDGTLAPGASVGRLTVSNRLALASLSGLSFDLGPTGDCVKVIGNLTLGGTLNITGASGFATNTYTLFTYTGALGCNGIRIGSVPDPSLSYIINTNMAGQVRLVVIRSRQQEISPAGFSFGTVATGTTATVSVVVTNRGDLVLSGAASVASPFAIVSGSPYTVPGGGSTRVVVRFAPTDIGTFEGHVRFASDGGDRIMAVAGIASATKPVADFTVTPTNGAAPLTVVFDASRSTGSVTNYGWDFGDGDGTNTAVTPVSHIYRAAGSYGVRLTAGGPDGDSVPLTRSNCVVVVAPGACIWTNPAASGDWSAPANWNPGAVPGAGTAVTIGTGGPTCVVDNVTRSIGSLLFNRAGECVIANTGGAGLALSGGITVSNNFTATLAVPVTLGAVSAWVVNGTGVVVAKGPVTGNGGITKSGSGVVVLNGTNGYMSATTINDGTVRLGSSDILQDGGAVVFGGGTAVWDVNGKTETIGVLTGTSGGTITLGTGGGVLTVNQIAATTFSGVITGNGAFTKSGNGQLTLSGKSTYTGATTITGSSPLAASIRLGVSHALPTNTALTVNNASLWLQGQTQQIGAFNGYGSGSIYNGSAVTGTIIFNLIVNAVSVPLAAATADANARKFNVVLQAASGAPAMNMYGNLNLHTGTTTVNTNAVLRMAQSGQSWAAAPAAYVANNLILDGGVLTDNGVATTLGANQGITLQSAGGTFSPTGIYTMTGNGTITGGGALFKCGAGNLTLNAGNNYSGGTSIGTGTLTCGHPDALGTGPLSMTGGLLNVGSVALSVGALSGSGTITGGGGTPSLTVTQSGDTTYSGVIRNGVAPVSFTKKGGGRLILAGLNTYTGPTTVTAGTLSVSGCLAGPVLVSGGATLGGSGTFGGSVTVGGMLSPGDPAGAMTISNHLVLATNSTWRFDLDDRVNVSSNLTLGGMLVMVTDGAIPPGRYTLFTYQGSLVTNEVVISPPPPPCEARLDTSVTGQVNLVVEWSAFARWQQDNFGNWTNSLANPDLDVDGDGMSNYQEFLAGTDPNVKGSCLDLKQVSSSTNGGFNVAWECVSGKTYQVMYTPSLFTNWLEDLPGSRITNLSGAPLLFYTDPTVTAETNRFYKVRVVP